MRDEARKATAWLASTLAHLVLLALVYSGNPADSGEGLRLMELDLVEMPGSVRAPSAARAQPSIAKTPLATRHSGASAGAGKAAARPVGDAGPVSPPQPAGAQSGAGGSLPVADPGWGSGEGLIISRPVSFPKNVQNEGIEGTVSLAIYLTAEGNPRVEMLKSSGDQRLDRYSQRVVTEAWRYAAPSSGVRLLVSLVFQDGLVEVVIDRATPWNGEDP